MRREIKNSTPIWSREEKYFQVRELHNFGFSYQDIVSLTGIGKSQISYIVKPATRAQVKVNRKEQRTNLNDFISQYKLDSKCVDCGFDLNSEALDLDHDKELKNFAISYGVRNKSKSSVLNEMKSCQVRCAVCHRYKTFMEERGVSKEELLKPLYSSKLLQEFHEHAQARMTDSSYVLPTKTGREFLNQYVYMLKESEPCSDCKQNFRYFAMDYDHVRGEKVNDLSQLMKIGVDNLNIILAEISKCELVCANCHRIRTSERRTN